MASAQLGHRCIKSMDWLKCQNPQIDAYLIVMKIDLKWHYKCNVIVLFKYQVKINFIRVGLIFFKISWYLWDSS